MIRSIALTLGMLVTAAVANAQVLGTFHWQLQPYCDVVTLTVAQQGAGTFTLNGFDDQCGAPQHASVVGTAFFNPDGTVGIGLTTVTAPGGAFVHIDARIGLQTLSGPWRDSAGNSGNLTFTPGASTGGPARPLAVNGIAPGSITAAQIDPSQVQARIAGTCPVGQYLRGVQANGAVVCEPLSSNTGDGSVGAKTYGYYVNTTITRDYPIGQVFLRSTGNPGSFQLCRENFGTDAFPYVRYVNGTRTTGSLGPGSCQSITVGAGGDFQIYIRRSAIFGVHAGDAGSLSQNYVVLSLSQL